MASKKVKVSPFISRMHKLFSAPPHSNETSNAISPKEADTNKASTSTQPASTGMSNQSSPPFPSPNAIPSTSTGGMSYVFI